MTLLWEEKEDTPTSVSATREEQKEAQRLEEMPLSPGLFLGVVLSHLPSLSVPSHPPILTPTPS